MGFWSSLFGAFESVAPVIALDAVALALRGGGTKKNGQLLNKSFASDAYGTTWFRNRGTNRMQGKMLWATGIQTTIWKTSSGGLFGIGQTSVYYYKYSMSMWIGFGKKLAGGPAIKILRIWADGKPLFDSVITSSILSGSVTLSTLTGDQPVGAIAVFVDVASGGTLNLVAGSIITFAGDTQTYIVQSGVNVTGAATEVPIPIWPPLEVAQSGGGVVSLAENGQSPYDLSSFDPDPHDGSHKAGGYDCPPGGIRFYLGTDDQLPDPFITFWMGGGVSTAGVGNAPGYRGICGVMIHDLQLINYGDHPPNITAEIAWDVGSPAYPLIGPIPDTNLILSSLSPEFLALPFSGTGALFFFNPLTQRSTYIWVFSQIGQDSSNDGTIYRVNTQTDTLEASTLVARIGTFRLTAAGMVADNQNYLYYVQNDTQLTKMDGTTLNPVAIWPPAGAAWGGFGGNVHSLYPWDSVQSLFGKDTLLHLMLADSWFFDRDVLLRLGTANNSSTELCVLGYHRRSDGFGDPIIGLGTPISIAGSAPWGGGDKSATDDAKGNLWLLGIPTLYKVDCQFISGVDLSALPNVVEELYLPTFAVSTTDVSSLLGGASAGSVQYYPGDNTIVIVGLHTAGKVDADTGLIVQSVSGLLSNMVKISGIYDPMGTMLVGTGSSPGMVRLDLQTLQESSTYNLANWAPATGGTSNAQYDPYTDSIWYSTDNNGGTFGGLSQALLDRAKGSGVDLADVVGSLVQDLNNKYGLTITYDVSQLAAQGLTVYGWEFDREPYLDSLRALMQYYLFMCVPIDGVLVFVPIGGDPIMTIPEEDIGALDDPSRYEPRVVETTQDPMEVPESVHIRYYDPLKNDQQATQYAKRISKAYPTSLSAAKLLTASRQELDLTFPLTEDATLVKQQADKILWNKWIERTTRKVKLPPKYSLLTPGDVIVLDYKGGALECRIQEIDIGASGALEVTARSQDRSILVSTFLTQGSAGNGSGTPLPPPSPNLNNYTISPTYPLSEVSPTDIHMVDVTATFSSTKRTFYNARDFTVADPGPGNTQVYYVTIYDPTFIGEVPGTVSLTGFCETDPAVAHVGQLGYINMGSIIDAGSGATGGSGGAGGQPPAGSGGVLAGEVAFTSTRGNFSVAHGLSQVPNDVQIQLTADGDVVFQSLRYDATNVYLVGSADGITGFLELFI